jgi:hypothetical protein
MGTKPSIAFFSLALFLAVFPETQAAPDFKIRYNPKFPCLEVMDSRAVKITDISEGTRGEMVSSGKASIKLSFLKNASGQPEVTLTDAKSTLSEMELEAFGLSVGMKPEGVVTVRFGADNKPQFEMDRTGGARFLMADLGNLDTAAGKELAAVPSPLNSSAAPSKALVRCRERFAAWKEGKGGWSNKSGKILKASRGDTLQIGKEQPRTLLEGEAVQVGGTILVGSKEPLIFQSAAGVFHEALPGTELVLSPLETSSPDIKIELKRGTLLTYVVSPLAAPRASLVGIGEGIVARTGDGLYQLSKGTDGTSIFSVSSGKVILSDIAGGAEKASVSANQKLTFPGEAKASVLAAGTPEAASLKAFPEACRQATLLDIAKDGIANCPEAAEEIFGEVRRLNAAVVPFLALQAVGIRPELLQKVRDLAGIQDLQPPATNEAAAFNEKADKWFATEAGPRTRVGMVLELQGAVKSNGEPLKLGDVVPVGATLETGPKSHVMFVSSPGVIGYLVDESKVVFLESRKEFQEEKLVSSYSKLKTEVGTVRIAIADGAGDKIKAEIDTPKGLVRGKSSSPKSTDKNP